MKVDIIFLDQIVCNYYEFIPLPDMEAIRPSVENIELIHHTKKAIQVNVDNKEYWIAKSLIRAITESEDKNTIFENEPYYKKYVDEIRLDK
jgi:hypothetical protein